MIDHLTKLRARNAARDYMQGVTIRQEASELSPARLAAKFEVSVHAVNRAIENMPTEALTDDESALVRACYSEHKSLANRAERLTLNALARHYQVTVPDIQVELDLAGYVSPFKREVVPA